VEIFLFDTTTNGLIQVTNTGKDSTSPSINFNGTRIAFESSADLVSGSNADGNIEIFLFDTTTSAFTQITNTTDPSNMRAPSINADGTRIAFHSEGPNFGVFLFDTTTNAFTQIANNGSDPSINADGTRIAFESSADLVSGGNTDGNVEIFLFDTTTDTFTQITNSVGVVGDVNNSASPAISSDGTRIAFASEADLTGDNSDGNEEIFLAVLAGLPPRPIGTTFGPTSSANPSGTAAEPVNTATGNYLFQRIDLIIPGRGLPVIFTRTYNSLDTYSGPLGHGWTHAFNVVLTEHGDGSVIIKHGDGHEEFYNPTGNCSTPHEIS
jgi:dipeptidyl aminopeptidase/acylaminoacyl peptidase